MRLRKPFYTNALNRLEATKEDGISPAERYYIYRRPDSEEHHIFRGTWNPILRRCSIDDELTSICQKMELKTPQERKAHEAFSCLDEQDARDQCAVLARKVCGICVSNLYATPDT